MTPNALSHLLKVRPADDAARSRVLVVDDDETNRVLLTSLLEARGHEAVEACDGVECLNVVDSDEIDLILLDIVMPNVDGFEVLQRLRRDHCEADLPIIMVTADTNTQHIVKAFQLGANDYVAKPIDVDLVSARIATQMKLRQAQIALRASEERYALAAQGTNDGLWDWELTTGAVYYSERWKTMLGLDESQELAKPEDWLGRIHEEDRQRVQWELEAHLRGDLPHFESQLRMRHEDATYRWMLCRGMAVRNDAGKATRIAGSLTDITEGKVADALTGLPNRLLFLDRLQRSIDRHQGRRRDTFAVLYLDLDNFKRINDSLGHEAGDQLLVAAARRLEGCVRACESLAARLGGDEFTVLLERVGTRTDAEITAQRIIDAMSAPFTLGTSGADREVYATASVGISYMSERINDAEDLVREADAAMYEAKSTGRSGFRVYDPAMHRQTSERMDLENELRRAAERNELFVHYQPIVELRTGRLVGFEALARWQHARLGLVAPTQFIPIAEEAGMIGDIGQFVLEMACRQMAEWKSSYRACDSLSLSVNVSSRQLSRDQLLEDVNQILEEVHLDPADLRIEITESAIMDNPEKGASLLASLRSRGLRVGIDDFGTGYSSLASLHRLSLDVLKVDRSFIDNMLQSPENTAIVRTILGLAESLHLDVVAEGIETEEQRDHLLTMGCRLGQGYLFSCPLSADEVDELLSVCGGAKDGSGSPNGILLGAEPSTTGPVTPGLGIG